MSNHSPKQSPLHSAHSSPQIVRKLIEPTIHAVHSAENLVKSGLHHIASAVDTNASLMNSVEHLHLHAIRIGLVAHNTIDIVEKHVIGHDCSIFEAACKNFVEDLAIFDEGAMITFSKEKMAAFLIVYDYCKHTLESEEFEEMKQKYVEDQEIDELLTAILDSVVTRCEMH